MVNKVAVVALVIIVSCPILIGYAMNLEKVAYIDYDQTGENVNVTPLLQTGTEYSYAHANVYDLNTNFKYISSEDDTTVSYAVPDYVNSNTQTKTPINYLQSKASGNWPGTSGITYDFTDNNTYKFWLSASYDRNTNDYLQVKVNYNTSNYQWTNRAHNVYFDNESKTASVAFYYLAGGYYYNYIHTYINVRSIEIKANTADYNAYSVLTQSYATNQSNFVDVSGGYRVGLNAFDPVTYTSNTGIYSNLPDNPKNVLITMDLSTISDSTYSFRIAVNLLSNDVLRFDKTTDSSGVHWAVYRNLSQVKVADLYYDPASSSNTYQIYLDNYGGEFRYVGAWPRIIGPANYFQQYTFKWNPGTGSPIASDIGKLYFFEKTPVMRIDDSEYRAFTYNIIENKTYDPSAFKQNPSTTIGNPSMYGDSISFGGNTYTVTDGSIMLGSKKIPVKNLELSSVPLQGGYYENRIGNTPISQTATPSMIVFNGKWSANITTISMEEVTKTKTEWTPGQFGWDGLDTNFLIVGLLTAVGAFIALGIAYRKAKSALFALAIACGGAAVLFFIMI